RDEDGDHRDDGSQLEGVEHVGLRERTGHARPTGLHDGPDDGDHGQQQEQPDPQGCRGDDQTSTPTSICRAGGGAGGCGAAHSSTSRRFSSEPVTSTSTNEIAKSSVATAAASANRNCDVKLKMNTGA